MGIHVDMIEDDDGNLVDVVYFCSGWCFRHETDRDSFGQAWPGGSETDYDVWCGHCGVHLWHGLDCDADCDAESRVFPSERWNEEVNT